MKFQVALNVSRFNGEKSLDELNSYLSGSKNGSIYSVVSVTPYYSSIGGTTSVHDAGAMLVILEKQ